MSHSGLKELQARRETDVALWERAHVPVAVRGGEHIVALEQMLRILRDLCFDMNMDPDKPH
ncbi:hypothetical protein [Streptomyces sp. NPDC088915]|uniref:hypothetical protein n=1 Tax=Streptomyces sp. NPDC088915 TaxID=3365912 RepID=UPI0038026CC0